MPNILTRCRSYSKRNFVLCVLASASSNVWCSSSTSVVGEHMFLDCTRVMGLSFLLFSSCFHISFISWYRGVAPQCVLSYNSNLLHIKRRGERVDLRIVHNYSKKIGTSFSHL